MKNTARLLKWIQEREKIRQLKEAGAPWPWTKDKILQIYRFCNVHREDDAVTKWIAGNWRTPNIKDPDLWFAMVVARFLNLPLSLEILGYPVPWKPRKFLALQKQDCNLFNAAYMIRSEVGSKIEYLEAKVLTPMWRLREDLRPHTGQTLQEFYNKLSERYGMGSFLSAQVVADLKYVEPLKSATDWHTFAGSGPGSRRGMNRVMGFDTDSPWKETDWHLYLMKLQQLVNAKLPEPLHAQDLQNCLCEFDKYERVRLGEGRPKQKYSYTGDTF